MKKKQKKKIKGLIIPGLTRHQKRKALQVIDLISKQRYRNFKRRKFANGNGTRRFHTKKSTASLMVSNDVLMMTMLLYLWDNRYSTMVDVSGAYLHVNIDNFLF